MILSVLRHNKRSEASFDIKCDKNKRRGLNGRQKLGITRWREVHVVVVCNGRLVCGETGVNFADFFVDK